MALGTENLGYFICNKVHERGGCNQGFAPPIHTTFQGSGGDEGGSLTGIFRKKQYCFVHLIDIRAMVACYLTPPSLTTGLVDIQFDFFDILRDHDCGILGFFFI